MENPIETRASGRAGRPEPNRLRVSGHVEAKVKRPQAAKDWLPGPRQPPEGVS